MISTRRQVILTAALLVAGQAWCALPARAEDQSVTALISLRVVNLPRGVRFPVFSGVPLPRGLVKDVRLLRLLEDDQEISAQFELLAQWPDGSVKSVLVGALVEPGHDYLLGLGSSPLPARPPVAAPAFPGDLSLVVQGTEYTLGRDRRQVGVVESSGPIRTVRKLTGKLTAANGRTSLEYVIRLYAYANSPFITADITVIDTRHEDDVKKPKSFEATGYGLTIPFPAVSYWIGGERVKVYEGPVGEGASLYQRGDAVFHDGWPWTFTKDYTGVGQGTRAPGWILVADKAQQTLAVIVKDFWQQFPKELTVTPQAVLVKFHPERANAEPKTPGNSHPRPRTFYFPRPGGAKTYQVLIGQFQDADEVGVVNRVFQAGPRLVAPAAWYAESRVFGRLVPGGPETAGYDRYLIEGIYDTSFAKFMESGGIAVTFGWRDFGDRLRGGNEGPVFYNDTHVGSTLYFIQYLRTLDERWWWIAEKASRHWMDLDVSHTTRSGHWGKSFGPGEPHLRHHDIYDHTSTNQHTGHAHLSGLPDYYLLTGDRRAYDVLREVGDWWTRAVGYFYPLPVLFWHVGEAERDFAWPIFAMDEAYRATGDVKYLKAAAHAVRHVIGWWQLSAPHWAGKIVGRNDWRQGTGFWTMWPRCDNCPYGYNGTNPWMAGALLSAVIQFSEYDQDTHLVDHELLQTMLLQCMNYVVKWGYDPVAKQFYYSEGTKRPDGVHTHLLYPLAYLGRLVQQGVPHRQWYDTADQWLEIVKPIYEGQAVEAWRGSQPSGFYGYECIWPADFWAVMKELYPRRRRPLPS